MMNYLVYLFRIGNNLTHKICVRIQVCELRKSASISKVLSGFSIKQDF